MGLRVVVTGGGTGGHIYPALAVVEALSTASPDAEIRYIGGTKGMEAEIVAATGVAFHAVTTRKLRKLASPDTIAVLFALWRGYREAAAFMRGFRPDVVVSTGGYVAAATALAAAQQGCPAVIQEQNAIPGRTNRWLERWATRVCVWFEETAAAFPEHKTVRTGVPIRRDIVAARSPAAARRAFGLMEDGFTVLVMGGSQGAQRVNEIVTAAARLLPDAVQFLHQTGASNHEAVRAAVAAGIGGRYEPRPYLDAREVPLAYRAADLVVCRCGVSTLAEVTANGLPALLVPLPTAYADHQTANARAIERGGAGVHLPQSALTPEKLAESIEALRGDAGRRAAMANASRAMGRPDAAERVARLAMEIAGGRKG